MPMTKISKSMKNCTVVFLFLTGLSWAQTGVYNSGGPLMPEQAAYDITFYDLTLFVNPDDSTIHGALRAEATVLEPLTWFVLDLDPLLQVEKVMQRGRSNANLLYFERRVGKLWIKLPEQAAVGEYLSVVVDYGGRPMIAPEPEPGSWSDGFIWSHSKSGEPWLGIVSVLNGADIWWPCKDHPSDEADSMALHITVPEPLTVATNGRLRDYVRHGGLPRMHTFHWFVSTPINNSGVTLNIAQYSELKDTYRSIGGEKVPVTFWVMPEDYVKAMRFFPQISKQLRFLEQTLGPYPFRADKYSVAQTRYSGMQHQTVISYGGSFRNNRYGFDADHFHELAHEWFANMVTVPDWQDWWLHEGIATYLEALYAESLYGIEAYHDYLADFRVGLQNRRAVAPRSSQRTRDIYGLDIYRKGAWMLHTLRYLIGKEALVQSLRLLAYPDSAMTYATDGSQCHFVTTADFERVVKDVSGQELDWFFEVYLRQPQLPRLISSQKGDRLSLHWDVPGDLPFRMPVEVRMGVGIRKVAMRSDEESISVSKNVLPVVDPDNWILRETPRFTTRKAN